MTVGEEGASKKASRPKTRRKKKIFSLGGRRYLSRCTLAGKTEDELYDFIAAEHLHLLSSFEYYMREGTTASSQIQCALIEFLKDTQFPISSHWFDHSWAPYSLLDLFVESNCKVAGSGEQFCGSFVRVFPRSPQDTVDQPSHMELTCRPVMIEQGPPGVLRWTQQDDDDPNNPVISGFGLHDGNAVFLIGVNSSPLPRENIVSYAVLRSPTYSLRRNGVSLFGVQAGTLVHRANSIAVAKRTVLVTTAQWKDWGDGESCPEPVKSWLFADGSGISVDLVTEGRDYDAGAI